MTSQPERPSARTVDVVVSDAVRSTRAVGKGPTRRFRRGDRLLDSRDFARVLRRGRRRSSAELVVVTRPLGPSTPGWRPSRDGAELQSRLGITVGRKAGPSVQRNRFKRRVREWFRHHRDAFREPVDLVVIARRPGIDLGLAELGAHLSRLLGLEEAQVAGKNQDS